LAGEEVGREGEKESNSNIEKSDHDVLVAA